MWPPPWPWRSDRGTSSEVRSSLIQRLNLITTHMIEVDAAGRYGFEVANHPSAENPRSSAVVPWAVVRSPRDLCGSSLRFI